MINNRQINVCAGVFAQQPCNKSFAELFQKRPSAPAGATAFFFFMSFFFLCLYSQKEKAGFFLTSYKSYNNFDTQIGTPLFLLTKKAQKKKFSKRKAPFKRFRSLRRATRATRP